MQRVRLRRTALRATPRMNTSTQPADIGCPFLSSSILRRLEVSFSRKEHAPVGYEYASQARDDYPFTFELTGALAPFNESSGKARHGSLYRFRWT